MSSFGSEKKRKIAVEIEPNCEGVHVISFLDSCVRIGVLKSSPAWPGHEAAGTKRFIFTIITIDLPSSQTAAGIDNFPTRATKNFAHSRRGRFDGCTTTQSALARFCSSGKARNESA